MQLIKNGKFDEERAFYSSKELRLLNCSFDGEADGESAFKESCNIETEECFFNLRYPFWHDKKILIKNSEMTSLCRAALWYSEDITVQNTKMHGIKALRECKNVNIIDSDIISPEFCWLCDNVELNSTRAEGEYFAFMSKNINAKKLEFKGKYSFQYIENATFENCDFDTKDAFWHAKNVVVKNCRVNGEYLAWYSENITFENCIISGTQPLCYCKGLKLINCEMNGADLSFELSDVCATLTSHVISIKNPLSGSIRVPSVGEFIIDDENSKCEIFVTQNNV